MLELSNNQEFGYGSFAMTEEEAIEEQRIAELLADRIAQASAEHRLTADIRYLGGRAIRAQAAPTEIRLAS